MPVDRNQWLPFEPFYFLLFLFLYTIYIEKNPFWIATGYIYYDKEE